MSDAPALPPYTGVNAIWVRLGAIVLTFMSGGVTIPFYFVAGLLVWIPLVITLWVLKLIVDVMDHSLLLLPEQYRERRGKGSGFPPRQHG